MRNQRRRYRVSVYDHRHTAVLLIEPPRNGGAPAAKRAAQTFIEEMVLGCYQGAARCDELGIVDVEEARSWYDADRVFRPRIDRCERLR